MELTHDELVEVLRAECGKAGSAAEWARRHGVNSTYLSHIFSGVAKIGPKVERPLGYERVSPERKYRKLDR